MNRAGIARRGLLGLMLASSLQAWAIHFDIELRTQPGPVAGARITTDFYGDLNLGGQLPIDGETGALIYPGYFSDLEGGPSLTDDPGFQAFAGTFTRGEVIAYRALGRLRWWNPTTRIWQAAPQGVELRLFGNIPIEVEIGYDTDPTTWAEQYAFYASGTRYSANGVAGPLTAVIDDAANNGGFHAHLDWKITTPDGSVAPAGAYMVRLQFWSPTLAGGQPKYSPSAAVQIVFERGISENQMRQAIQARIDAGQAQTLPPAARVPRGPWSLPAQLPGD